MVIDNDASPETTSRTGIPRATVLDDFIGITPSASSHTGTATGWAAPESNEAGQGIHQHRLPKKDDLYFSDQH
ncbi:hypothetical protein ACFV2H_06240 [Streptomyces sp. NPDC059629]|uniref:hypothetical protein n=1 Tax=Streptomyces sp. NPDC059629 TaxID=3346889 RepID=UPI0036C2A0A2